MPYAIICDLFQNKPVARYVAQAEIFKTMNLLPFFSKAST